jgi:hypothetical protein
MNRVIAILFISISVALFLYVNPASPEFPKAPVGSVQSFEPADVESPLRRGYYTNLNRQEVISHYEKEFNRGFAYAPRLNYPPEEAPAIIRDQTKSSYLEEIVHPLRESIYINGFTPKEEQYAQYYEGVRYNQKIIIRYVPSNQWLRLLVIIGSTFFGYMLFLEYINAKSKN